MNKNEKENLTNYLSDMMAKRRKAIQKNKSSDEEEANWSDN